MSEEPSTKQKRAERDLSRRERQIMDLLYEFGRASASDIHTALPDAPSYTAVRTHLAILQERGQVKYHTEGARYIYEPVVPPDEMAKTVIESVMKTFFGNSVERVVATLINNEEASISPDELERLAILIEQARRDGR